MLRALDSAKAKLEAKRAEVDAKREECEQIKLALQVCPHRDGIEMA